MNGWWCCGDDHDRDSEGNMILDKGDSDIDDNDTDNNDNDDNHYYDNNYDGNDD